MAEFGGGERTGVQVCRREAVKFGVDGPDFFFGLLCRFLHEFPATLPVGGELRGQPVGCFIRQGDRIECGRNLHIHGFFAKVRLGAVQFPTLGAAQIVVAFLGVHGDAIAAFTAMEEAAVDVGLEAGGIGLAPTLHHVLDLVEHCLVDERLMGTLVEFAVEIEETTVEGILEEVLIAGNRYQSVAKATQALGVHRLTQAIECVFASGIQFEGHGDKRRLRWVDDNRPGLRVVEVAERRLPGPDTVRDFLPLTATDVDREAVGIIFALSEREVEHQLALRSRLKPERAEPQIADRVVVNEVDDPTAIKRISGEPIRMPSDDAVGFPCLHSVEHFVEERSSLGHGALAFLKTPDHLQILLPDQVADLGQLVAYAAGLTLLPACRFANVDEVAMRRLGYCRLGCRLSHTYW